MWHKQFTKTDRYINGSGEQKKWTMKIHSIKYQLTRTKWRFNEENFSIKTTTGVLLMSIPTQHCCQRSEDNILRLSGRIFIRINIRPVSCKRGLRSFKRRNSLKILPPECRFKISNKLVKIQSELDFLISLSLFPKGESFLCLLQNALCGN